jgi:hypothetical protein
MRDEGREIGTSVREQVRDTLDRLVTRGVSGRAFGHVWTRVLRGVDDQVEVRVYDRVDNMMYKQVIRKW